MKKTMKLHKQYLALRDNAQSSESNQEILSLVNKSHLRKLKLSQKNPKMRTSETIIAKYPEPKFKTPLVLGPGRYDWEHARDAFTSNNSGKSVPMFMLQDRTDYRSIDAIQGPVRKKVNFENPYEAMNIQQGSLDNLKACSRSQLASISIKDQHFSSITKVKCPREHSSGNDQALAGKDTLPSIRAFGK
jgi:hypothetical protein